MRSPSRTGVLRLIGIVSGVVSICLLDSCGQKNVLDQPTIEVQMSLSQSSGDHTNLQLAGTTSGVPVASFIMSLSGCASGLSASSTASQTVMNVYLADRNCKAKLTSFSDGVLTYTPVGGTDFTTWAQNDTAIFKSTTTADFAYLTVVKQLTAGGVVVGDYISYNAVFDKASTSSNLVVGSAQNIYVSGQDAPNFKINTGDASFLTVDSTGKGQFKFKLTCNTNNPMLVGAHSTNTTWCPTVLNSVFSSGSGVDVWGASNADSSALLSYVLIADTSGIGSLTLPNARLAFPTMTSGATVNWATDFIGSATNASGFTTITLTGPGTLATSSKMILVLMAKNPVFPGVLNYASFQYFPISLPAVAP